MSKWNLRALNLRQLKRIAIIAPLVFLAGVDAIRHAAAPDVLHAWPGHLVVGALVLTGIVIFSNAVTGIMERAQNHLEQQNRELLAVHEAGLAIAGDLNLEGVLQKAVDQARELVGARYGALSILRESGGIELFITSGLSAEERARIGPLPQGHGLLGVVLNEGQRLRLLDLNTDDRAVGFPPHHPPMRSLLAVPVIAHGNIVGNLYLAEKTGAEPSVAHQFTDDDEGVLLRFATQVAIAITNARLHRQVHSLAITEERERIAREMHDTVAQVLGYVNTKAQAAQELLAAGQVEQAEKQIAQLASAARTAYVDVRENILALRTSVSLERPLIDALGEYVTLWQDQSGITAELTLDAVDGVLPLDPTGELQVLRIVQEALANVRKHAAARHTSIRFGADDGWVVVTIEDDGAGFEPATQVRGAFPRFGLSTMRERAQAIGGDLVITSAPGAGTRVVARVPAVNRV